MILGMLINAQQINSIAVSIFESQCTFHWSYLNNIGVGLSSYLSKHLNEYTYIYRWHTNRRPCVASPVPPLANGSSINYGIANGLGKGWGRGLGIGYGGLAGWLARLQQELDCKTKCLCLCRLSYGVVHLHILQMFSRTN